MRVPAARHPSPSTAASSRLLRRAMLALSRLAKEALLRPLPRPQHCRHSWTRLWQPSPAQPSPAQLGPVTGPGQPHTAARDRPGPW